MSINQNTTELQNLLEAVNSLPNALDTSDANAAAADILTGKSGYVNGQKVNGSMPNNGAIDLSINGLDTTSVDIPEGYTSGGTVHMTDDVPNAAETLKTWLTDNGVTVPDGTLLDGLVGLLGNVEVSGGTINGKTFVCGQITPAEDITTDYDVNHEYIPMHIGSNKFSPLLVFWITPLENENVPNLSWVSFVLGCRTRNYGFSFANYIHSTGDLRTEITSGMIGSNEYSSKFTIYCSSSHMLVAGRTYNWIRISNIS